jgi:hypothetical protein
VPRGKGDELIAKADEEWISSDKKSVRPLLN